MHHAVFFYRVHYDENVILTFIVFKAAADDDFIVLFFGWQCFQHLAFIRDIYIYNNMS